MKKRLTGVMIATLFALSPIMHVQAGFVEDVSTWVQTSFFGPKIFGGFGKSKEEGVSTKKTLPAKTKKIKLLEETVDHPIMKSYAAPKTYTTPKTYTAPKTSVIQSPPKSASVPGGCKNGICCWDSDNGVSFSSRGNTRLETISGVSLKSFVDETLGNGVLEYYCQENAQMGMMYAECENGVGDGVCLGEPTTTGTLTAEMGATVYSDILLPGQTDREIMKVRLRASGEKVRISSLQFKNLNDSSIGSQMDFKLYNEAGQLLQVKQMTPAGGMMGGALFFDLSPQDEIVVPKNESTMITIKGDIRNIDQANQAGGLLKLGLMSITADGRPETVVNVQSEAFVIYKSELSVKHAAAQPNFQDPTSQMQEVYRFNVTSDTTDEIELGKLTFDVSLQGMKGGATLSVGDFRVLLVKMDGTLDDTATVATIDSVTNASEVAARISVNFINQKFDQGETRMYALMLGNTENTWGGENEDDSVSVSIVREGDFFASDDRTTVARFNDIAWSDEASSSHSDMTKDWHNGYLLDVDSAAQVNSDSGSTTNKERGLQLSPSGVDTDIAVGDNFSEVGAFLLATEGSVGITSLSLENVGSAAIGEEYLANLSLYSEGQQLSTSHPVINGNLLQFYFNNGALPVGNKRFSVRADILGARGFDSMLQFKVKEVGLADGSVVNFAGPNVLKKYTVKRGEVMLSTEGSVEDVKVKDGDQVTLLKGRVTLGEPILLRSFHLAFSGMAASFQNYQLFINGQSVGMSMDEGNGLVTLSTAYEMGGTSLLEIKALIPPTQKETESRINIDSTGVTAGYSHGGQEYIPREYLLGNIKGYSILQSPQQEEQSACAKEGEISNGSLPPEYYVPCCSGLESFNPNPSNLVGGGVMCYDPTKGKPVCVNGGAQSEGWYQNKQLLKAMNCAKEESIKMTCHDSDNGLDYYTKGSAYLTGGRALPVPKNDVCSDKSILSEQYCVTTSNIGHQEYKCENGCIDGACRREPDVDLKEAPVDLAGNKIWHLSWQNQWVYAKGYCQIVKGKTTYKSFKTAKTTGKVCRCDRSFGCKGESCTSNQEYYTEIICAD